jgi:hypothetical protein
MPFGISSFDARAWYWVAADKRVFASARELVVDDTDADYQAFIAAGKIPSAWPRDEGGMQTDDALQAVLEPLGLFVNLHFYTSYRRWLTEQGGLTVNIAAGPIPIKTDDRSQAKINGVRIAALAEKLTGTTAWRAADGNFYDLGAGDVDAISNALQVHIDQCFSTAQTLHAGIAGGTITTREQIDQAFAGSIQKSKPSTKKKK